MSSLIHPFEKSNKYIVPKMHTRFRKHFHIHELAQRHMTIFCIHFLTYNDDLGEMTDMCFCVYRYIDAYALTYLLRPGVKTPAFLSGSSWGTASHWTMYTYWLNYFYLPVTPLSPTPHGLELQMCVTMTTAVLLHGWGAGGLNLDPHTKTSGISPTDTASPALL